MHVLLTNDDGPPSDTYSPYFHYLVEAIHKYTDWHVTVVLPDTQRSWIGKAHMIGQTITATYIEAPAAIGGEIRGPYKRVPKDVDPKNVWTLLNGTPATCTNIGLNYMVDDTKGPVDLVISGPNFGRNTTALYSTTSGTIGAAMEGALCGSKGIALSYAYYSRHLVPEVVAEASRLAVKLIDKLYHNWDKGVDLYSINVPLIEGLSDDTKAIHAPILQNRWKGTFEPWEKAVDHDQSEADGNIPIEPDSEPLSDAQKAKEGYTMFRWAPDFEAVGKSVKASSPGNDGWVVDQGHISVTGLKASFAETGITGEIVLNDKNESETTSSAHGFLLTIPQTAYLHPLFSQSVKKHLPDVSLGSGSEKTFHYGEYEDLDFDKLGSRDKSYFGCSYIYRKALIRKHYLANTIAMFRAKNPDSILNQSFPDTFNLELDYAEFLDESLDEAYELRQELEKNDEIEDVSERKLWILKPSMSDKAQGIRLFSTIDELQAIFDSFEEGYNSDDEEEQEEEDDNNGVITSQLRHFIVQEYVDKPLILAGHGNKKFHIRTYVLAVGDINVYVYKHMLALFAPREYATDDEVHDLSRHLTNTCLRDDDTILKESLVEEFWNLKGLEKEQKEAVFAKICDNVRDLFLAATTVDKINFQPLANSMEFFGLDFLVDENLNVHILEVNSYPDFKQTGDELKYVVEGLVDETVQVAVKPWFDGGEAAESALLKRVL